MSTTPEAPQEPREGNLHELSDDDYFAALPTMPKVYDAEGKEVTGLFDDVVDMREVKRMEAAQLEAEQAEQEDGA